MPGFHLFATPEGGALALEHSIEVLRRVAPRAGLRLVSRQPLPLAIALLIVVARGGTLHRAGHPPFEHRPDVPAAV